MNSLLDDDQSNIDPIAYVREKFKLAADAVIDPALAKSKLESDQYIKLMERQKDELANDYLKLKADYDARATLEEMLDKRQIQDNNANTPNANNYKPYDPIDIEKLVDSRLSSYERQQKANANLKQVQDLLRDKLGSRYRETLRNKMEELDLTQDEMDSLAARSPKAFIRTLGLEDPKPQQPAFQTPMSSQYNSANFKPTTEKRTWAYYQDLKAKDPKAWLDPKIQTQMYHDAQRLGADFGDGDFNQYDDRLSQ